MKQLPIFFIVLFFFIAPLYPQDNTAGYKIEIQKGGIMELDGGAVGDAEYLCVYSINISRYSGDKIGCLYTISFKNLYYYDGKTDKYIRVGQFDPERKSSFIPIQELQLIIDDVIYSVFKRSDATSRYGTDAWFYFPPDVLSKLKNCSSVVIKVREGSYGKKGEDTRTVTIPSDKINVVNTFFSK